MIIFLNGAFGIGKTTVARLLRDRLPGSAIFDPELFGMVLQRLPRWIPGSGRGTDDFQDLARWRRGNIGAMRLAHAFRSTLIVPMAFSNLDYLREFLDGAERFDPAIRHFCLTAPLAVVRERIEQRAGRGRAVDRSWQLRRAAECCSAHQAPEFAEHVATEHRTPEDIALEIDRRIRSCR